MTDRLSPAGESEISMAIRTALGCRSDTRLFRNNVGTFLQINGNTSRAIEALRRAGLSVTVTKVGLCPGSSDLIGWHTVTVTPEMVGSKVAIFTAIETKREGGRTAAERFERQMNFINKVNESGGCAGMVTSVEQAELILRI